MVHCDSSDHNVLHLASSDETVMARFGVQTHVRTPIVNLSAVIIAHTGIILGVYHVHEEKKNTFCL